MSDIRIDSAFAIETSGDLRLVVTRAASSSATMHSAASLCRFYPEFGRPTCDSRVTASGLRTCPTPRERCGAAVPTVATVCSSQIHRCSLSYRAGRLMVRRLRSWISKRGDPRRFCSYRHRGEQRRKCSPKISPRLTQDGPQTVSKWSLVVIYISRRASSCWI